MFGEVGAAGDEAASHLEQRTRASDGAVESDQVGAVCFGGVSD